MNPLLSERDDEILGGLATQARLLSLQQIAVNWWEGEVANARRRLKQLGDVQLIERIEVRVRSLPPLIEPVATWRPGATVPDFEATAYRLQSRWHSLAVRGCSAYIATERAARIYGGKNRGQLKHPLQATHDLALSQIWLQLRRTAPDWAKAWRGEDLLAHTRQGEKCPDAFIVNETEQVVCVVEFGGQYNAERVREFHEDCATRGLPYQIW
jgi:hypothetical protein